MIRNAVLLAVGAIALVALMMAVRSVPVSPERGSTTPQTGRAGEPSGPSESATSTDPAASAQPSRFERFYPVAERLLACAESDDRAYERLVELCDDIGHRISGSEGLERAIEWAVAAMQADGQENVRTQAVMVPVWVRGAESLELVHPRRDTLAMLGLGNSVGTPPEGITADVIVVADERALAARREELAGKIVLFDHPMPAYDPQRGTGYGSTVRYRVMGARLAEMHGAVAALVRSVTARSLRSPHTGSSRPSESGGIPTAAVSVEDAMMLARLQARGITPRVTLKMEARMAPDAPSANVIGELVGRDLPHEIVVIGGHIDSWDIGQGAHDDGAGCVATMHALRLLREMELRPRRTIRVVLWTNEENGTAGAREYVRACAEELPFHVAALESDSGGFAPRGFSAGHADSKREDAAAAELGELLRPLARINAARARNGGSGADIEPLRGSGAVLLSHDVDNSTYFDFHHTAADTVDKVDPRDLARNAAAIAYVAYVLAEMPGRLGAPDMPDSSPPPPAARGGVDGTAGE
ncbi:MAG: M20/M25/M40 family metallo-hydrolase [Planctomycetia bacterium]|nr:MAG: M20/M25/M40 family metallo-hydrolase [Planctomycetia bacterium]